MTRPVMQATISETGCFEGLVSLVKWGDSGACAKCGERSAVNPFSAR